MDLPYKVDYAKSGRCSCKGCKAAIKKDTLRLAVTLPSSKFDGKTPNWYHFTCFFDKQRPRTIDDIEDYESLRYDDQKEIRGKIEEYIGCSGNGGVVSPGKVEASGNDGVVLRAKRGKKRDAPAEVVLEDYTIEYAKSGRAKCRDCDQKILKDQVRVSKKNYESDDAKRYGLKDMWHHLSCFAKLRSELGYFGDGDALPGFNLLAKGDQQEVRKHLPLMKQKDVPEAKRIKKEKDDPIEKEIEAQNKIMFEYRDRLKKELTKEELGFLLKMNKQHVPPGKENMLDRLADVMTFGALEECNNCGGREIVFKKSAYVCQGYSTDWSKCLTVQKIPKKRAFVVPEELFDHPFLKEYKYVERTRVIRGKNSTGIVTVQTEDEEADYKLKIEREKTPLCGMEFVILGKPYPGKDIIKKEVVRLGGKVVTKIKGSVMAIISTPEYVQKNGARIQQARSAKIHVVSKDFLDSAKEYAGRIPNLVKKKSIAKWGSNPQKRLPPESSKPQKPKPTFSKTDLDDLMLTIKKASVVDPDCEVAHRTHVYTYKGDIYNAILGSIQGKKRSYYRLQLLRSDWGNSYWIFSSWGRLDTSFKDCKLEPMNWQYSAMERFQKLYLEKSGNRWEHRDDFVRIPRKMYAIGVDCGAEDQDIKLKINTEIPSKLPQPVQDLIKIIFDIDAMKKVLSEFGLTTREMSIGNIRQQYIQSSYVILSIIQRLIDNNAPKDQIQNKSSTFYVLIPQSFGAEVPPVINDAETIREKIEILNNLSGLQIAGEVMYSSGADRSLDAYYTNLRTDIEILDEKTKKFNIIREYVRNTQAPTCQQYDLEIVRVFKIKRQGESDRFKPYSNLHNRKLLWYGAKKTNFVSILSQGLRIPPLEIPTTGFKFGKGIYFYDSVSKSANDCCTDSTESTGFMLLCEVALGDMLECTQPNYIEKLPEGKHSCKGVGRTQPNPWIVKNIDNIEVPLGKLKSIQNMSHSDLLYNEYIVYNAAQVNIKYLLQMNFKYKY